MRVNTRYLFPSSRTFRFREDGIDANRTSHVLVEFRELKARRRPHWMVGDGVGGSVLSVYLCEGTRNEPRRVSGADGRLKHGLYGISALGNGGACAGEH